MHLDTAFNLLLFLFWYRAWSGLRAHAVYNPYLVRLDRLAGAVVNFLRPVFGRTPAWGISTLALLFLILLRGLACSRTPGTWTLHLGFAAGGPDAASILSCMLFSLLSFGVFLFKCWGLALILLMLNPSLHRESPTGFLADISRPFTSLPMAVLPPALLAFGAGLAWLLGQANALPAFALPLASSPGGGDPTSSMLALRLGVTALAGWVDMLNLMQTAMLWAIIGSMLGAVSGHTQVAWFCQDWIDAMLGPLRRYPVRLGMFDLTPLIFFLVIRHLVYPFFMGALLKAHTVLA